MKGPAACRSGGSRPLLLLAVVLAVLPAGAQEGPRQDDRRSGAGAAPDEQSALQLLLDYRPTTALPVDPEVVAAEQVLRRSMPRLVRDGGPVRDRLAALHQERRDRLLPSAQRRIAAADPLARTLVRFDDERTLRTAVAAVTPHPAAALFPGSVPPDARPEQLQATIDLAVPGWHSLSRYAAPGARIVVATTDGTKPRPGLVIRIGAHADDVSRRDAWARMPRISRVFPFDAPAVEVANAHGGLVYLEVRAPGAGLLPIVIDGAVPAPRFVLDETTAAAWRNGIRQQPGPWAELGTRKVVLTVPSERIRDLDDPTGLLQFWDRVLDGAADLAALPHERRRPERYVADVQISAGSMHAGYPIMTHLDAVADMVTLERLRRGPWGLFHELGHNHQHRDWTFAGTGEVTVNLFSLYLCETLCGVSWREAWNGNLARAEQRHREHLRAGRRPWGTDEARPDLALRLYMYVQIVQDFGWEALMHTFAEYRDLADDERPQTDQDKRDQWLVRLSRAVDRDLGPFFAAWGVEVSAAARAAVAGLPAYERR